MTAGKGEEFSIINHEYWCIEIIVNSPWYSRGSQTSYQLPNPVYYTLCCAHLTNDNAFFTACVNNQTIVFYNQKKGFWFYEIYFGGSKCSDVIGQILRHCESVDIIFHLWNVSILTSWQHISLLKVLYTPFDRTSAQIANIKIWSNSFTASGIHFLFSV